MFRTCLKMLTWNSLIRLRSRVRSRCQIGLSLYGGRRMVSLRPKFPIVSFTFDDFPQSAFRVGGEILESYGGRGTYFVSLSLMDREIPAGRAFSKEDLLGAIEGGHELGCHTYAHCHAWETEPSAFERSILENRRTLKSLLPEATFQTLSYPVACPRPGTKRVAGKHFVCCRGGGRALTSGRANNRGCTDPILNIGRVDANNLQSFFLEKSNGDSGAITRLIDINAEKQGWLILATHEISRTPTPLGCSPAFFERIVEYAVASGAKILPMFRAYTACRDEPLAREKKAEERIQPACAGGSIGDRE